MEHPSLTKEKKKCPKCDKGYLEHRTPRPFLVKTVLFWLPVKRFRCNYCNKKTYILDTADDAKKMQTA